MSGWWEEPLRIIQTNLQIPNAQQIDPKRLAQQIDEMGGNALVFNVGGIYAWYDTEVKEHNQNPYLPEDGDLLKAVIEACHDRSIKFIGRFDFSKARTEIYQRNPEWFARSPNGDPKLVDPERPGEWSTLVLTCVNSGYRGEDLAVPVLEEAISRYDLDGIFYNATSFVPCHCETCQEQYETKYGEPLPNDPGEFDPSWGEACVMDQMQERYTRIKELDEDIAMVQYYFLPDDREADNNLLERAEAKDLLCVESQNVLSRGHQDLPHRLKPTFTMKMGRSIPDDPNPLGIIHSCPGMDWRHTGLPPVEYESWMSQIPANGGVIWHSLTGIPETIGDKRILKNVENINEKARTVEDHIRDAESAAQTLLLWDDSIAARTLGEGLAQNQIDFDMLLEEQVSVERLADYSLVVLPEGWDYTQEFVRRLETYVGEGGNLLVEGDIPSEERLSDLLGVQLDHKTGEYLVASYLRFEDSPVDLQAELEEMELVPFRGHVTYCDPQPTSDVPLTLVPPFATVETAGRPPERATPPVSRTDIPMAISSSHGDGNVLYFPFSLSYLIDEYRLGDHYQLLANGVDSLLEARFVDVATRQGLQITTFERDNQYVINLINQAGERPLKTNVPMRDVRVELTTEGETIQSVRNVAEQQDLDYVQTGEVTEFSVPELNVWTPIVVEKKPC